MHGDAHYSFGALGSSRSGALRDFGFEVLWRRYPMQHSVCAEEIRDLGDWMTARFAAG